MSMTYKLSEIMPPAFFELHRRIRAGEVTEALCEGGRGGAKSSFISEEIELQMMRHPDTHAVVLRRKENTLRRTVYNQYIWAAGALGVGSKWKATVSPMELTYLPTGQKIMFFGLDDPGNLKSIKLPFGYVAYVHFEELDQFRGPEEVRNVEQSLLRGGPIAITFKSFNPPASAANWANQYARESKPGQVKHHSTYLETPPEWLGPRFIADAEHLKALRPMAYRNEYLGEVTGGGANVFENIQLRAITDEELGRFDRIYRGIDWGYYPDPWAYNCMHYDAARLTLYIFDEAEAYMSTLACNEIAMSAGASARGTWINDQLTRFLLPQLKNAVQLAGAGGRVVVKPYPSGRNIYCEIIPADRIYPTRINGAGVTEAGFFTDFAALRGRKVVRVEAWDLQPDGLYLQNRAYWYNTGDTLGGELALTDVPEWAGLEPEVVIRGVDRPLFGELRMPMANTVDETSKLPVSLYARAVDTMAELDRIYSEFLWEIHTGKRKRIVDRTAIKPDKSGGGVPFRDQTTDLYLSMDLTGDMGQGDPFRDYTPALRVEEYQKAIDIQCRLLERQTGFSPGTFSFDLKSGRMTATQVVSDDKETYNMVVEQAVEPPMGKTENPAATVRRRLAEQGRPLMYPKRRTKLELEEMAGTAVAVAVGPEDCLHLRRLMARQNYRPVSGSRRTADRRGKGLLVQMAGRAV